MGMFYSLQGRWKKHAWVSAAEMLISEAGHGGQALVSYQLISAPTANLWCLFISIL